MLDVAILTIIPELTQYEYDTLLPLVSSEKQERIKRFHFFRDARNCILGDVLARSEICRATGLSNKQLEFSTNEFGKPFLINDLHINFNISHAGNYVACVLSDKPVGIDIEIIKPVDMVIVKRFFTQDETEYIMTGEQNKRFYEIWTKKESYIKWDGKGLHMPLNSFCVINRDEQIPPYYHTVFNNKDATGNVCSAHIEAPIIKLLDTRSFLRDFMLLS